MPKHEILEEYLSDYVIDKVEGLPKQEAVEVVETVIRYLHVFFLDDTKDEIKAEEETARRIDAEFAQQNVLDAAKVGEAA